MMMTESHSKVGAPAILPGVESGAEPTLSTVPTFASIYKQYFDFVWSSARHLGASADAIDDVVQDSFIVIHSRLATLQNPGALRSWIYGVVRRTVSDFRRARRTRDAASARLGAELRSNRPLQPSPLEMAEISSEMDLLESVLTEIDETKREVFVMVEVLEMTVPEVVQALDIPLNTAYSRLRLARKLFEEALARHEVSRRENR
jgi:RNA polymerase sigma-70 factor (ECF subfamily)